MHIFLKIVRFDILFISALYLFLIYLNYSPALSLGHNWGGDFSAYIMQAKAIVSNSIDEYYLLNSKIISHSNVLLGPESYGWGYPFILSILISIFGESFMLMKWLNVLFILSIPLAVLFIDNNFIKKREKYFFVIVFPFNSWLIDFSDHILSDLAFTSIFFILIVVYINFKERFELSVGVLMAIASVFLVSIREGGLVFFIALIAASLIDTIIKRNINRERYLQLFTYILTFIIGITFLSYVIPSGNSKHIEILQSASFHRFIDNMIYYYDIFPKLLSVKYLNIDINGIFLFLMVPFLIGLIALLKINPVIPLSIIGLFLLYSIWPVRQGPRFLLPILPLFLLCLIVGSRYLFHSSINKFAIKAISLTIITIMLMNSYINVERNYGKKRTVDGPHNPKFQEVIDHIYKIKVDERVIFRKPRVFFLYTGIPAFAINDVNKIISGDLVIDDKTAINHSHGQLSREEINTLIEHEELKVVYDNKRFSILKRR